jgi:hypothetical protein
VALHIKSAYTGTLCAYAISASKVGSTFSSLCCVEEARGTVGIIYRPPLLFGMVSRGINGLMNVRSLQQAKSIKGGLLHMNELRPSHSGLAVLTLPTAFELYPA